MVALLSVVRRFPSLRFLARAITLALIAFPLVNLALAIESDITHASEEATFAMIAAFGVLLTVTLTLIRRMFRTVP